MPFLGVEGIQSYCYNVNYQDFDLQMLLVPQEHLHVQLHVSTHQCNYQKRIIQPFCTLVKHLMSSTQSAMEEEVFGVKPWLRDLCSIVIM